VDKHYAHPAPAVDLQQRIARLGIDACCTALMTAVRLERVQIVVERELPLAVAVIATVGLGNAMAAGRAGLNGTECREFVPGTINLIVVVDARLSPSARVNAIITATEAKVLALMEAGVMTADGYQASGTSTDAVVVASTERGESCEYAGPCTPIGAMLARAVLTAVRGGLSWDIDKCGR
jgi:adenosylcobinamide amidohydrolase